MSKPILCLDFDGVIHDYREGWKDGTIYGELTEGFLDWAHQAGKLFELVIYSSRSKDKDGAFTMAHWISVKAKEQGWSTTDWPGGDEDIDGMKSPMRLLHAKRADVIVFRFAHEKPPAFLTIDDRCVQFRGGWNSPWIAPDVLRAFKPWMG